MVKFTLNHKISYNSMKFGIIVITSSAEFGKITTSLWSMVPVEFNSYLTHPTTQTSIKNITCACIYYSYIYEVSIIANCGFHDLSGMPPAP